uniref:Uncharacterized protein n=1 Tax=Timema tahoe TaxID=61484 RepID=A0A7R9NXL1_9NEOP|nr:unnamed protein product [Timema tahoe]
MDYDVMNKDSQDRLLDSFHSDCARVETLAMESLREQPMPILTMMLSLLTDYVTCAYRGPDWFFTFHRKTDRYGARSLFVSLNSSWYSLFCCCTPQDMTEDQLAGALSSLTRSVSRLLDVSHRLMFKGALEAGQARLRLFKQQQNLPQGQETSASGHTPISALKENASKENWAGLCNVEVNSDNQEQFIQPTPVTVKTSLSPLPHRKKKTKKYTCDITKYIVKPSENKVVSSLPLESGFFPSTKENKAQEALVPMSPNSALPYTVKSVGGDDWLLLPLKVLEVILAPSTIKSVGGDDWLLLPLKVLEAMIELLLPLKVLEVMIGSFYR